MSNNPYYDDPADEEYYYDAEWDIDVIDAPDGSSEWEVRAHPGVSANFDDITECWFHAGYLASIDAQAGLPPTNQEHGEG